MVSVPLAPAKLEPARLPMATVMPLMVTLCRSSSPSASDRVKVPLANSLGDAAFEPLDRPASSTTSLAPPFPGSTVRLGTSLLPVMVMVTVAELSSPSASRMV
ncbi:hypothetical protein D3C78_1569380 [compost metagenome]